MNGLFAKLSIIELQTSHEPTAHEVCLLFLPLGLGEVAPLGLSTGTRLQWSAHPAAIAFCRFFANNRMGGGYLYQSGVDTKNYSTAHLPFGHRV